jgi:PAS domain S-box-containing protein
MQNSDNSQAVSAESTSDIVNCNSHEEEKIRVLHVDDEPELLTIVKHYVENYEPRIQIDSVDSPERALQLIRYNNYDCIVSDYQMPEMNGFLFAQKVRAITLTPFIFYTGQGSEDVAERAFANGLDDYIKKETGSSHYSLLAKRITTAVYKNRAENELLTKAQARDVYETLVEMAPEGIITVDMDGFVRSSNEAYHTLTGFDRCEIVGKHILQLGTIRREYIPQFQRLFQELDESNSFPPLEYRYNRKDGSVGWGHATYKVLQLNGERRLLVVNKDVSRENLDELKLNVMGRISRHDIRNKLAIIMGYQDIARMKLKKGEDVTEFLDGIRNNCNNVLNILDLNREFQAIGVEQMAPMDVELCFKQAAEYYDLTRLNVELDCQVNVTADSLLMKVFYYLIDNSLKHGENLKSISVYADQEQIVYVDDGGGFPEGKRKRFFGDDLETMGLHGLTLIRKVVESYGWILSEEGKVGEGVKFVFRIHMK